MPVCEGGHTQWSLMSNVYFSYLSERNGAASDQCFIAALNVAWYCGALRYKPLVLEYGRTDDIRNKLVYRFRQLASDPNDCLVMLDADHLHPKGVVSRLAAYETSKGVIAGLNFLRGENHRPLLFIRDPEDRSVYMALGPDEIPDNMLVAADAVGTGAIMIRRWVFDELEKKGFKAPFFRYEYPEENDPGRGNPSEDMYFSRLCEAAGIQVWCDTGLVSPHQMLRFADKSSWEQYFNEHIDQFVRRELDV